MEDNTKSPSFQLYSKDALDIKVLRMSDAAQGVYWRLLWNIHAHTKTQYSIQDSDKYLAKILGLSNYKWKSYRKEIQMKSDPLLIEKDGELISKRLMEEREKQLVRREQTQKASNIRWERERMQTDMRLHIQTDGQMHMQTACPSSSSSSSSSIKKEKSALISPNVYGLTPEKEAKKETLFGNPFLKEIEEKCFGLGIRFTLSSLKDLVDTFQKEDIIEAVALTARQGKTNLSYTKGILMGRTRDKAKEFQDREIEKKRIDKEQVELDKKAKQWEVQATDPKKAREFIQDITKTLTQGMSIG